MARSIVCSIIAALVLVPLAARAQEQGEGTWSDGTWSGDDSGDEARSDSDYAAPRDGYAPRDDQDARPDRYGPTMADFRDGLDDYGDWISVPEYGTVWRPARVTYDWRPYLDGQWAWTDAGWTWISDEPFGWATYHYGRWAFLDGAGWVWLPGHVWAPAWVSWRWGGGYAGWCPLGPRGYVVAEPRQWVFVESPHFTQPIRRYASPITAGPAVFSNARALPVQSRGPHAGPAVHWVEREVGARIRPMPIVEAQTPRAASVGARFSGASGVQVYRPRSARIIAPVIERTRPALTESPSARAHEVPGEWPEARREGRGPGEREEHHAQGEPRAHEREGNAADPEQPHRPPAWFAPAARPYGAGSTGQPVPGDRRSLPPAHHGAAEHPAAHGSEPQARPAAAPHPVVRAKK